MAVSAGPRIQVSNTEDPRATSVGSRPGEYLHTDRGVEPPTSGPTAIHDTSNQGSGFGYFSYFLNPTTRLSLITGTAVNHFQIPANPNQPQVFPLIGVPVYPSADIHEGQLEQNYFGVLALQGTVGSNIDYQLAPFSRYSTVSFYPDYEGDLIYNGAASKVFRSDWSNGFQLDTAYHGFQGHTIRWGGYFDSERAEIDNHEAIFPATPPPQSNSTPFGIVDNLGLQTWIYSVYLQDEWKPFEQLTINYGARFDLYDGLVRADQASPRVGLEYTPIKGTTLHAAYARQFTPPPTELVSVSTIAKFKDTTGAPASNGNGTPTVERDHLFDAGVIQQVLPGLNVGIDAYYKKAADLIDEGQFGPALIFETFNYHKGRVWGTEFTSSYNHENLYTYANFAYSVAQGTQVESGQFNFAPDELKYINSHYIFLDHDQTFTSSAGAAYRWNGFTLTFDGIYGSGLRSGFANTGNLPFYIQLNAGIIKRIELAEKGAIELRAAVENLADHTYLVRNGTGVGVFANQYGPAARVLWRHQVGASVQQTASSGESDDVMNQWIGITAEDDIYRPQPWRRFVLTGPLAVIAMIAMLLGSRFLKPSLPHPPEHNAIEAQLVEVIPPPKPAGLQGGPAAAPVKPKTVEKPHPKQVATHHPKVVAPPVIAPSETSEVGTGPAVPTTSGPASGKEASVGIPGGTGRRQRRGHRQRCLGSARHLRADADDSR